MESASKDSEMNVSPSTPEYPRKLEPCVSPLPEPQLQSKDEQIVITDHSQAILERTTWDDRSWRIAHDDDR